MDSHPALTVYKFSETFEEPNVPSGTFVLALRSNMKPVRTIPMEEKQAAMDNMNKTVDNWLGLLENPSRVLPGDRVDLQTPSFSIFRPESEVLTDSDVPMSELTYCSRSSSTRSTVSCGSTTSSSDFIHAPHPEAIPLPFTKSPASRSRTSSISSYRSNRSTSSTGSFSAPEFLASPDPEDVPLPFFEDENGFIVYY